MRRSLCLCLLVSLSHACSLFNRVRLDPVAASFQKPSNVAVFVAARDGDRPIVDLQPESFRIYENEQLLDADQTQQVLLPQELAAYHHALLLVDVSGEGSAEPLARAAATFVEAARAQQALTVFAFDGGPNLRLVAEFPKSADTGAVDLHALAQLSRSDSSRNLNGALVSGLKELDTRLAAQAKHVKVGTLVVFTRGPDLAGRIKDGEAEVALNESEHDVVGIGIGESTAHTVFSKNAVNAPDEDALGVAFAEAAEKARDLYQKYYLLAYCSPARSGTRRLKVEARFRNADGQDQLASFTRDFDATGFGPGCHSDSVPRFVAQPSSKSGGHGPSAAGAGGNSNQAERAAPATELRPPTPGDDDSVAPPPNQPGYSH